VSPNRACLLDTWFLGLTQGGGDRNIYFLVRPDRKFRKEKVVGMLMIAKEEK
jgi:hypothetical protein